MEAWVDVAEKMEIKTSVIIPVYNTGKYLEECIDSVFRQTQNETEVIAINDGSTDDSGNILCQLQQEHPGLIVITQENHGLGYTRNVGLKRARGKYIYFLDSDDYILKDTLERCYDCAVKNKLDIVMFDAFSFEDSSERKAIKPNYDDRHEIIKERNEVFSGISFLKRYCQSTYSPSACLLYCSADFLKRNDIWFLPRCFFEDNEFYCRVMTLAKRVMYIPQMFYQYRCRSSSITQTEFDLKKARDHIDVVSAIADLRTLYEGKGWPAVKQISFKLLQYAAHMCHTNGLYREDAMLPERILKVWIKICGCEIDDNENMEEINYIYKISRDFPDLYWHDERKKIAFRRKRLFTQIFGKLLLHKSDCKVAIYGCGKYADRFLNIYEEQIAPLEAQIIFLDSFVKKNSVQYRGYSVYHISAIAEKDLDYILIASPIYEDEMSNAVRGFYGDKFKTIKLYGDLHIDV